MQEYQYKNPKGQEVGYIKGGIYYTERDNAKNQIFRIHGNGIAIGAEILRNLRKNKIELVRVRVINLETLSFWLEASIAQIMTGTIINYDKTRSGYNYTGYGLQYVLPMEYWRRLPKKEQTLLKF